MPSTFFDSYADLAFAVGLGALTVTALVICLIVMLRLYLQRLVRLERAVTLRWRPVLLDALSHDKSLNLPDLARGDEQLFLTLWVYLQESLRVSANARLNEIARQLGCDRIALRLAHSRRRARQLLGIVALGHLRSPDAWDTLAKQVLSKDPTLSLFAAQAVTRLDPARAAALLLPMLVKRKDWSLMQVAALLADARNEFEARLDAVLIGLAPRLWQRALQLADALRLNLPQPALLHILHNSPSAETTIAALRLAASPALLPAVRRFLVDARWQVRAEAARYLSRFGNADDVAVLERLLIDEQWWVRYEAGRALLQMPFYGPKSLEALRTQRTQQELDGGAADPRASAMLQHVLAERQSALI